MKISIAIPTHNRAGELEQTLRTLSEIDTRSVEDYEVLVVGNGCTDDTEHVARHFAPAFGGRLRYVNEDNLGLNHARNRAVAESRFEVLALLDDDVQVDSGWLSAVVMAFQSEDCAAVGGKAYLIYPQEKPRWLGEKVEGHLSKVDQGPHRRLAAADELYGLNLSIQKQWIGRVGPFRPDLDRIGSCLISGGEIELLERIASIGGKLIYEPAAVVGHRVPAARLRRKWFWSRCYWTSWGFARTEANQTSPLRLLRRSTWLLMRTTLLIFSESLSQGNRSPEVFYLSTRWVGQMGTWVGSVLRLLRRLKQLAGQHLGHFIRTESGDPATCQEKSLQSNVLAAKP
jgi:glycosyltransferase involved in cell wall biosynthesis